MAVIERRVYVESPLRNRPDVILLFLDFPVHRPFRLACHTTNLVIGLHSLFPVTASRHVLRALVVRLCFFFSFLYLRPPDGRVHSRVFQPSPLPHCTAACRGLRRPRAPRPTHLVCPLHTSLYKRLCDISLCIDYCSGTTIQTLFLRSRTLPTFATFRTPREKRYKLV